MKLAYRINDELKVEVVKGEDRTLVIRLMEQASMKPVDITGASLVVDFPGEDRSLKRRSAGLSFSDASVVVADDEIAIAGHGLVDGDAVTLSSTGTLPAGLDDETTYYVKVVDRDTIQLSESDGGAAVNITAAAGGGVHSLSAVGAAISGNGVLGTISVTLSDAFTALLKAGEYQDMEVEYTVAGVTTVVQLLKALTVQDQAHE